MHVLARVYSNLVDAQDECISLREIYTHPTQSKSSMAGTVLLRNVSVASNIRGEVIEAHQKRVKPRREIAMWPKMRYVTSVAGYVDMESGGRVTKARAVYMVGGSIHYLP